MSKHLSPKIPIIMSPCPPFPSDGSHRSRKQHQLLRWFSVAVVLLTGWHPLHAQGAADALFIDEKGNLSIGTTTFIYQSGNVGIGTLEPTSSLSVAGGVAVGNSYAKSNPAPANDLIVEGNVGIGTSSPYAKAKLEVANQFLDDTAFQPLISLVANQKNESLSNTFDESKPSYGIEFFRRWNSAPLPRLQAGIYAWGTGNYGTGLAFRTSANESSGLASHMVITDKGNVGIGTTGPNDKLDVAGNLRVLTDANPIRFTSKWSAFPDGKSNQAEIANDTDVYKALMIVGNRSGGGTTRRVGIWDQLQVNGDLFVTGRLVYKWGDNWRQVYQERNDWAGSRGTPGPTLSDLRLKTEMQSLPSALDKIRHLRGVSYKWNDEALKYFTRDIETTLSAGPNATAADNQKLWQTERDKRYKLLDTPQVGVVAQDVEAVLPEAVTTDKAGYKSVQYQYLIPLLIEALKEQEKTVAAQAKVVAWQQTEIERLSAAQKSAQKQLSELDAVKAQVARLENVMQHFASTQASGSPAALKIAFRDPGELIATGKKQ